MAHLLLENAIAGEKVLAARRVATFRRGHRPGLSLTAEILAVPFRRRFRVERQSGHVRTIRGGPNPCAGDWIEGVGIRSEG